MAHTQILEGILSSPTSPRRTNTHSCAGWALHKVTSCHLHWRHHDLCTKCHNFPAAVNSNKIGTLWKFSKMEGNCGDYRPQGSFSPLMWNYYYGLPASTLVRIQQFSALSSAWPCKSGQGLKASSGLSLKTLAADLRLCPWHCSDLVRLLSALPLCHACLLTAPTSHRGYSRASFSLHAPFLSSGLHHAGHPISKLHPVPLPNLILALLSVTTFIICDTFFFILIHFILVSVKETPCRQKSLFSSMWIPGT